MATVDVKGLRQSLHVASVVLVLFMTSIRQTFVPFLIL